MNIETLMTIFCEEMEEYIKGVGEKRAEEIMVVIEKRMFGG